ncbi:MAG: hypothetical protein DHS20C20_32900 [Ardenticatenaceae bacterium]|nr:MAG: hypothetical protein DHS20C20_32900 [Ardenticatenaceae bacterium]
MFKLTTLPSFARLDRETDVWRWVARLDWVSVAVFILPLLLYWLTLAPTIYNLDSAEFTTAVATNGIIRATGYPLYLLLGKLWSWLPLSSDMGYRMNFFSAFLSALTLLQAEYILRRLKVSLWLRLGALGLLATAPYFWAMSLIAEVYTLHTALMAGIILTLLRWAEQPSPLRLALPIFLMTASLGNHMATVLLVPGAVWYVLTSHPAQFKNWRVCAAAGTAVLLGLTVFLILPLRYVSQPLFNYAGEYDASGVFHPVNLMRLSGIWWLITGQSFAGQMFGYQLNEIWPQVAAYGVQLWTAFLAIGIGPGLLGLGVLTRRNWRLGGMLLLMFLANAIFYINYRVIDKDTMFLPTYLIWAIWLGVGYQQLALWLQSQAQSLVTPRLIRVLAVGAVVLAVGLNWRLVDRSGDWSTREMAETILQEVELNALVLGWWDTVPAVQYLQLVEGQRPDVQTVNRFLITGAAMEQLILSQIDERPVYINNPSMALLQQTTATPLGPIYKLERRVESVP